MMLNITINKKNANQTLMQNPLTLVRMAIIKKNLQTINIGEDVGTRELSHIAGGTVN